MARAKGAVTTKKKRATKKPLSGKMAMFVTKGGQALGSVKALEEATVTLDYEQLKRSLPHLPTGSLVIDYLIGGEPNSFGVRPCPGLPKGRVSQIWGHESSGKTTLALTAAATTCANGGCVIYIDWENDIVPDYAAALGVPITDPNRFRLLAPDTLEDGVKLAMAACEAGIELVVFDSVGAGVPAATVNRDISQVGEQTRVGGPQVVWSNELPNLKRKAAKCGGTHIMGISQIRAKINTKGVPNAGPTTQPQGGNAWKFYASVRLELRRIKQEKGKEHNVLTHKMDERVVGGVIRCKVIKCKLSRSQGREEKFYIRWGEGIDDLRTVLEIAIAHNLVKRSGSWLTWNGPSGEVKKQGISQFRKHLVAHEKDFDALYQASVKFLGTTKFAEEELEDLSDVEELMAEDADELINGPDLSEVGSPPV